MQIGIEDQVLAEETVLALDGFLDLYDHAGLVPNGLRSVLQGGAGLYVLLIGEAGAQSGTLLHQYGVSSLHKGADRVRGQSHTELIVFDFLYYTDRHVHSPFYV